MTERRKLDLPDGLVDVRGCLAEAAEVRRQSWNDPAVRRFGLRFLAGNLAMIGLAALIAAVVTQVPRPGEIEVAKTQAVERPIQENQY